MISVTCPAEEIGQEDRFRSYAIVDRMTGKIVVSRGISPERLAREFPGS